MTDAVEYENEVYVHTSCKDCAKNIYHNGPEGKWGNTYKLVASNIHLTIHYDMVSKHYLVIIKSSPEKMFYTCAVPLEELETDAEVGKMLTWAGEGQE